MARTVTLPRGYEQGCPRSAGAQPEPFAHPRGAKKLDMTMPITYGEVDLMADTMREKGIRPEIELFHPGHYWVVNELIRNGKITPPYFIQFVLGFQTSIYPTPANVLNLSLIHISEPTRPY